MAQRVDIAAARLTELTQQLVAIPSVVGSEAEISEWLLRFLRNLGLEVVQLEIEDSGPSLVVIMRGSLDNPRFLVSIHMDTFPLSEGWSVDPFDHPIQDDRLYGLGAHDAKGGLACILGVLEALVSSNASLRGTLVVALTTDEELWSRGAHAVINGGYLEGCVGALIPEPTPSRALRIGARGRHFLRFDLQGRTASSARGEPSINAVEDATRLGAALARIELPWDRTFLMRGNVEHAWVQGGEEGSILVPETASIAFNCNVMPGQTSEDLLPYIEQAIQRARIESQLTMIWDDRPTPVPLPYVVEDPLVGVVTRRMEIYQGSPIRHILGGSVSDANHFFHYGGFSVLVYGPQGGNTDQDDEYVLTDTLVPVARTYAQVIIDVLGLA